MMMIERAVMLRMSRSVDFADRADVPLGVDLDVPKMMTFKAGLTITWVVLEERSVGVFVMDST